MKSKKKLIISLSVAVAVLLVTVVAIVSISAALNQNISSKVKVNFKPSQHVIGYVSAEYIFGSTVHSMTTNGEKYGDKKISFVYMEDEKMKSLQMLKSDLSNGRLIMYEDVEFVTFKFDFRNTGVSDFIVELDVGDITTNDNMKLSYSFNNVSWYDEFPEMLVRAPTLIDYTNRLCYIKIEPKDTGLDASFEGSFVWNLTAVEDK